MLVRVGSLQTHDDFWVNPDHVISVRLERSSRAAIIKLSDGSTHNVKADTGASAVEAELINLLNGKARAIRSET